MKKDDLKTAVGCYLVIAVFAVQIIFLTCIYTQQGDILTQIDSGESIYLGEVQALRETNTALLEENEILKDSYMDTTGDLKAVKEILEQITYDEIVSNPGGVDLWIQIAVQTLEGK